MAISEKYSHKGFRWGVEIFRTLGKLRTALDAGTIPADIVGLLADADVAILPDYTIAKQDTRTRWLIADGKIEINVLWEAGNIRHGTQAVYIFYLPLRYTKDISGTIVGSSFGCEEPDSHIFPEAMTGVTFEGCNLDNVYVAPGNTVGAGCTHKHITVEADGEQWLRVDGVIIEPLAKELYDKFGISKRPEDIVATLDGESIIKIKRREEVIK